MMTLEQVLALFDNVETPAGRQRLADISPGSLILTSSPAKIILGGSSELMLMAREPLAGL